jgi:hypothetical protein
LPAGWAAVLFALLLLVNSLSIHIVYASWSLLAVAFFFAHFRLSVVVMIDWQLVAGGCRHLMLTLGASGLDSQGFAIICACSPSVNAGLGMDGKSL